MLKEIVRTSKHPFEFSSNTGKHEMLYYLLKNYHEALQNYVDYLYNNIIVFEIKNKEKTASTTHVLSLKDELYDAPSMLDYKVISFETNLSARALSSAMTEACGIIKGVANRRKKLQEKIQWCKDNNKPCKLVEEQYQKELEVDSPVITREQAELSSKCCIFEEDNRHFNGWIKLRSLGEPYGNILIPVSFTKHSNNLIKKGFSMMGSFLICENHIEIRWGKKVEQKIEGILAGCDTGIKDIVSFSSDDILNPGFVSDCVYDGFLRKLSRQRRNSKNYKQTLIARDNHINYVINQCNFDLIQQLNIENNSNLKYRSYKGKYLGSHAYGKIRTKLERKCEENGVRVKFTPSTYKSQRCSSCGWTQKSNRKGKVFCCKQCQHTEDADKNSSRNQKITNLPYISWSVRDLRLNRKGFYWNPEGIHDESGRSLESLVQECNQKGII